MTVSDKRDHSEYLRVMGDGVQVSRGLLFGEKQTLIFIHLFVSDYVYGQSHGRAATHFASSKARGSQRTARSALTLARVAS